MCFPFSHAAALGFRLDVHPAISVADIILILDCDVLWIPSRNQPNEKLGLLTLMATSGYPCYLGRGIKVVSIN